MFVADSPAASSPSSDPVRFPCPFTVPEDAESITVRLLPLDRSLAVELAGELRHGMSPEQVRLAWGEPDEDTPAGQYGIDRRWRYPDRYVAFAAGTVIAFATVPEAAAKPSSLRCSGGR
jgi:hypothetical protein